MAQSITAMMMRSDYPNHHIVRVAELVWESYVDICEWLTDGSRPGFYSTYIDRDNTGQLYRFYLLSHSDTAMEFKIRWM